MTASRRVWIPKHEYRGVVPKLSYTDAELVEFFLEITHSWYEDKENLLFGWRDRVRDELLRCLNENGEANTPHQLIYAEMKFSREWTGPEGMFTNEESPWEVGLNPSPNHEGIADVEKGSGPVAHGDESQ